MTCFDCKVCFGSKFTSSAEGRRFNWFIYDSMTSLFACGRFSKSRGLSAFIHRPVILCSRTAQKRLLRRLEAHGIVGLSDVTPGVCDVICVQRYSLNAFVSLFKMSLFFFLEGKSIEHSFNFNFSVAIIFPAELILLKNNAEYEYDDFPKNDGVTRSLCCIVSKLQPQNFYNQPALSVRSLFSRH